MVHDQLRQLLLEHDCVTLPGLGALLAEPVPARIHPVRHTLSPPARRVIFSDRLRHDDGLLTTAVRASLAAAGTGTIPGSEADEAPARVRSFTEELRAVLRQHRAAELRGLGTLRQLTDTDPIRFEALEPGYLPLASSFGLPELVSRPVMATDRSRATRYVPEPAPGTGPQLRPVPSRLRRLVGEGTEPLYRLATAAVVVLSLTATYFNFQLTPLANRYLAQPAQLLLTRTAATEPQRAAVAAPADAPVARPAPAPSPSPAEDAAWTAQPDAVAPHKRAPSPDALGAVALTRPAPKPAERPVAHRLASPAPRPVAARVLVAPAAAAKPAAAPSATVPTSADAMRKAPTNRYYLIWNAFTTPAKADKGRQQVLALAPAAAGTAPSVLAPPRGSALYRVAVADFATAEEAQAAKPALRARYGPALWVLRY